MEKHDIIKEKNQYLTFKVGEETFGISIAHVKEIIEYGGVTPLPMMPKFIKGVINLRGTAVPVIELATRLGKESSEITRLTCILIVEIVHNDEQVDVGLMVDSVNEVLALAADQIEPPPKFGSSIRTDFIDGMGKINDDFVVLLRPDRVLTMEEMSLLEGASQKGQEILSE